MNIDEGLKRVVVVVFFFVLFIPTDFVLFLSTPRFRWAKIKKKIKQCAFSSAIQIGDGGGGGVRKEVGRSN